jgi:hypothetical protein
VRTAEAQIAAGDTIPHEVVAQQLRERYLK